MAAVGLYYVYHYIFINIFHSLKCDGVYHCEDHLDEINCFILEMPKQDSYHYNKEMAPIEQYSDGSLKPVVVNVSLDLLDIDTIEVKI